MFRLLGYINAMKPSAILVFLSIFGAFSVAQAKLEFEKTTAELKAKPSDEKLPVTFKFKNTGKEPVEISEIKSGCSCLKAETDKTTYAPGESGQVDVVFKIGSFTGY